jgi:hypothetical protein
MNLKSGDLCRVFCGSSNSNHRILDMLTYFYECNSQNDSRGFLFSGELFVVLEKCEKVRFDGKIPLLKVLSSKGIIYLILNPGKIEAL